MCFTVPVKLAIGSVCQLHNRPAAQIRRARTSWQPSYRLSRLRCYASGLNVDAYLDRIEYTGSRDPTLTTLRSLHIAHLYAVPFENLDIRLGRPLSLDVPAVFEKI